MAAIICQGDEREIRDALWSFGQLADRRTRDILADLLEGPIPANDVPGRLGEGAAVIMRLCRLERAGFVTGTRHVDGDMIYRVFHLNEAGRRVTKAAGITRVETVRRPHMILSQSAVTKYQACLKPVAARHAAQDSLPDRDEDAGDNPQK